MTIWKLNFGIFFILGQTLSHLLRNYFNSILMLDKYLKVINNRHLYFFLRTSKNPGGQAKAAVNR